MKLAERLRAHVVKMQSEEPLDDLGGWIAGAVDLLREAADAMTPKPWPPGDDVTQIIGIWGDFPEDFFVDAIERSADEDWCLEAPPRSWLPWPEGGGE